MLVSFITSVMTLSTMSLSTDHISSHNRIKTCFTNTNKYFILPQKEYKLRQKNIHKLSTSIENPTLHQMKNSEIPTYILKHQLPLSNVETYISENHCSPFILFTILNQCCNNLALYHGLLNCYHSNTTISNFDIYHNHICKLSDIETDDKILTLRTKINDYDMLFDSYINKISEKNKHFMNIALMFKASFMEKMIPDICDEKVLYPEEPKPPSPRLLLSNSETSCISG